MAQTILFGLMAVAVVFNGYWLMRNMKKFDRLNDRLEERRDAKVRKETRPDMPFNTLDDMDLIDKIVLTRVDINVPVDSGKVTDATRIERIVPTIKDIQLKGGKPVLLAHFGRPKGEPKPEFSLRVTVPALEEALGQDVTFIERPDRETLEGTPKDAVILIENTRFSSMEEKNDPKMAQFLASLGDVYCNDAFSAAHRAHASTEGVAKLLPACAGRLMEAELTALNKALGEPEHPLTAVVGGAKVSTKLELLSNLLTKVDHLIIGGGMANTFLAAQGVEIGKSLAEHDMAETAREIMAKAQAENCTIHLPVDVVVAQKFEANAWSKTVPVAECPTDAMILDAGNETVEAIKEIIRGSKTLVWNGPLGAFEIEPFDKATVAAARFAGDATRIGNLLSVAGGGDTVAALNLAGAAKDFTYVSTAGGAFLEWLEGKTLPGVAALETARARSTNSSEQQTSGVSMSKEQQIQQMTSGEGFIAALDQSGGSTPKALKLYGVNEDAYSSEEEMFDLVHAMRARIATAPAFNGDKVIGAILFEMTMDREINGMPTAQYLWQERQVVPFLKIDKGLANEADGVQLMKPIPGLDDLLSRAVDHGIFGTKERSVINQASANGIDAVVAQQFELGAQVLSHGLVPIIEPEVTISIADKAEAEDLLLASITKHLDGVPDDQKVMLKLSLPSKANLYKPLVDHPKVMRVVALSGGYERDEANAILAQNTGVIASFSRALSEGLSAQQSDAEFNATIAEAIDAIHAASVAG